MDMKTVITIALIIIVCTMFLFGCAGSLVGKIEEDYEKMLNKIPPNTIEEFHYNRTGLVSSASIDAFGLKKEAEKLTVENITIKAHYWSQQAQIILKGYQRELKITQ